MDLLTFKSFTNLVTSYNPDEVARVSKAYEYAKIKHTGQYRESGEEYITHPLSVAYILAQMHADGDTLCAGLLHDVLEDTDTTKDEIALLFNDTIANLVDGVTKLNKEYFNSPLEANYANIRKIILGLMEDARIIAIKLADRLHNMRTLGFKNPERRAAIADETLNIFCPLAYAIGAYDIKTELENLALYHKDIERYNQISECREEISMRSEATIHEVLLKIQTMLADNNIPSELKFRIKSIYAIYKKLQEGHKITNIHDILALKIMVENIETCYTTLGLVHGVYRPMNSKFKDYICNPKKNLYQSLHTTVFGPHDDLVQMQIKTQEMSTVAEKGILAYWDSQKGLAGTVMKEALQRNFPFYSVLQQIDLSYSDDEAFFNQVKSELLARKIYVYTTTGEIIELPEGSSVIDFAYQIHTELGNTLADAIVNDEFVSPFYILHDKDRVKIITDKRSGGPTPEWEKTAVTIRARRRIRDYLKNNS